MKMKKAVALFMTASLAAGMLAGCGGSGDEGGSSSSGKIELEFFTQKEKLQKPLIKLLRSSITARMKL